MQDIYVSVRYGSNLHMFSHLQVVLMHNYVGIVVVHLSVIRLLFVSLTE